MENEDITTTLRLLLKQIETRINTLNEEGAGAFRKGKYERARDVVEEATRLKSFRAKAESLRKEWNELPAFSEPRKSPVSSAKRRDFGKLEKGMRTQEEAFRVPILRTLAEMGGSGLVRDVLDVVEEKMGAILNEHDYEPLSSNPKELRWRNNAQWCRNTLVTEGLMKKGSPTGIWEISEAGLNALRTTETQ